MLKAETGETVVVFRPLNTVRAQGVTGAHDIEQIPAGIAVLPAIGVRIVEVTVKNIAADFIVKANVVIADNTGARHAEGLMDLRAELRFAKTLFQRQLWRNAG